MQSTQVFSWLFLMGFLVISPQGVANPCQGQTNMAYITKPAMTPTPFKELEPAFAQLTSGDHLWICAGIYRLHAGIEFNDLRHAVIEGQNASLVADVDVPIITLYNAYQVTLKGLHLVHDLGEWCAQNTLEVYDSNQVTIINNDLDGSGYFGVAISSSADTILKNNLIHNAFYGLGNWNSPSTQVDGNIFTNNAHNFTGLSEDEIDTIAKNNTVTVEGNRKRPKSGDFAGLALFDCKKSSNDTEKRICQIPQLGLLDNRMTKLYRAHKRLNDNFDLIRQHQRDWLKLRNGCGPDKECIRQMYQERINNLVDQLPE